MYNLFVRSGEWNGHRDEVARIYVNDELKNIDPPNLDQLRLMPAIFASETDPSRAPQFARVGEIISAKKLGDAFYVEYRFNPNIPPISQKDFIALGPALAVRPKSGSWWGDLAHSAWYVKDADLYRVLFTEFRKPVRQSKLFQLDDPQHVNQDLLGVMMPFKGTDAVWAGIQSAAATAGMSVQRADNIWEHAAIIQDIISLIDRSAIIVCDCTDKNPNVFYEMGIAHALGKEVIIITQQKGDIPFDIGHLRYIHYLNNEQGIDKLTDDLAARIWSLRL